MFKRTPILLIISVLLVICISASVWTIYKNIDHSGNEETMSTITICPPLPNSFQINDLIGTWQAKYGDGSTDTLIIQGDGKYKQIYNDPSSKLSFESGLLDWQAEKRESGFIRLHMIGMHRCDDLGSVCTRQGGGVDPKELRSIDYCEGQVIEMPNEVVLIVTGVPSSNSNIPRGIWLRQTRLAGVDWSYTFELQENK
jgi:hypothetical protein